MSFDTDGPGYSASFAGMKPEGTPGTIGVGTLQTQISLYTYTGTGQIVAHQATIGFLDN